MVAAAASDVAPTMRRRAVDREIDAWSHRASRHHSHDAHKRLQQHRAVADKPRVAFADDHLWRGARRNQRMKSADRSARNGDEAKRKNFPGKNRAASVDKARQRRHQHLRSHQQDSRSQRKNRTRFDERAQIIARREQQPHRQCGRRKPVHNKRERQRAHRSA